MAARLGCKKRKRIIFTHLNTRSIRLLKIAHPHLVQLPARCEPGRRYPGCSTDTSFWVARYNGVWQIIQSTEAPTDIPSLTPREIEVLTWAASGKSEVAIAEILLITKRTVDEHISNAARKLGAANKTQAVALALLRRIIEA